MSKILPWEVTATRITYEDEWLRVRTDTCKTGAGKLIENFHIIEPKDWVNIIALTDGGEVVCIREYRHGVGAVTLGLPGGVCDDEDVSPAITAARELEEETGYICSTVVATGQTCANWADHSNQIFYFLGFGATRTGQINLDENEEIEVDLQPYEAFSAYDFDGPKHSHHAAALFFAERYFKQHPETFPNSLNASGTQA